MKQRRSTFVLSMLCFGLAFLYIPMILLIIYSFNYSKLVPVWGGFSTRWYTVLFESEEMWAALGLSLHWNSTVSRGAFVVYSASEERFCNIQLA